MTLSRPTVETLYDSRIPSGNGYKVRLLLSHLGLTETVEVVDLDILKKPSETREAWFLEINPNGRIPLVVLSDGSHLAESNAILCYLADETPFLSSDPLVRARALSWMFFEQYSHERFIAVLKYWTYWGGLENTSAEDVAVWQREGQAALRVMNRHLEKQAFFSGERYGIADIALFAYTQSADAIGYDLGDLRALERWLDAVRAQPGYVPIKKDPLGRAPDLR